MQSDAFKPRIDLHGERVEEALARLERFLDRAILSDERDVTVIHGHGSGFLKSAVRDYLKTSAYVSTFRPGDPWEGSDAVTIVTINK